MQAQEIIEEFNKLDDAGKRVVRSGIGSPTGRAVNAIWLIVVTAIAVVAVGGLGGLIVLILDDKGTEPVLAIVSAAVGGLIGLIAPSPTTQA